MEKQILLKPSLEQLYESNARKETWILKARLLEEVRGTVVRRIVSGLDLAGEEGVTLSVLASYAGTEKEKALRECQSVLRALLENIRDLNDRNKNLLDASLQFIRGSAAFVNDLLSPAAGYLDTGKRNIMSGNGKLLCTEG